ncbi:unnamed protein product [Tilletia controversa]|uniref:PIN domain-containing protein n=2 Tax=Tilletia TaxID=13289 RepID=A0ABN7IZB1_9BASI|nr:unnamed protein product [Tilletia caries]CAD6951101.1 unnamed protein product [Tilletia controversa]CAD6960246.1 unnamed protein product [Tilletia caries]
MQTMLNPTHHLSLHCGVRSSGSAHGKAGAGRNKGRGQDAAMWAASQAGHSLDGVKPGRTYADFANAAAAAVSSSTSSSCSSSSRGPVRITISKGAHYTIDPATGLPRYEEIWEEEEMAEPGPAALSTGELNPDVPWDVRCRREQPGQSRSSANATPLGVRRGGGQSGPAVPHSGIQQVEAMEIAPHGRELDANAEDAHQMVANSSFIQVQQSSTSLYTGAGPSVMVLDTNTLLEHFVFLRQLFSLLLVRNLSALLISNVWPKSASHLLYAVPVEFRPAPFRLALPHIVIRELDGLKTGGRSDSVRTAARQANRWILACLQAQKRSVSTFLSKDAIEMVMRAAIAAGGAPTDVAAAAEATTAALIPPEAWALHFETARQYKERMKEDSTGGRGRTNDEQIVDLCVSLAASTTLPVWLLSNDTNARTHAEIEGIRALELENIVREPAKPSVPAKAISGAGTLTSSHAQNYGDMPDGDGVRWSKKRAAAALSDPSVAAQQLVEQWDEQVGNTVSHPVLSPLAIEPALSTFEGAFLSPMDADGDEAMEL